MKTTIISCVILFVFLLYVGHLSITIKPFTAQLPYWHRSLYGKTGTGRVNGKDVNGWFVGYIESDNNTYYFATNIQAPSNATGSQATEITETILSDFGIWK